MTLPVQLGDLHISRVTWGKENFVEISHQHSTRKRQWSRELLKKGVESADKVLQLKKSWLREMKERSWNLTDSAKRQTNELSSSQLFSSHLVVIIYGDDLPTSGTNDTKDNSIVWLLFICVIFSLFFLSRFFLFKLNLRLLFLRASVSTRLLANNNQL